MSVADGAAVPPRQDVEIVPDDVDGARGICRRDLGHEGEWSAPAFAESALLYLGAGVGLVALPHARTALRARATETPLRRADVGLLVVLTIFGSVLGPVLLLTGFSRTSGLIGSLALG